MPISYSHPCQAAVCQYSEKPWPWEYLDELTYKERVTSQHYDRTCWQFFGLAKLVSHSPETSVLLLEWQ